MRKNFNYPYVFVCVLSLAFILFMHFCVPGAHGRAKEAEPSGPQVEIIKKIEKISGNSFRFFFELERPIVASAYLYETSKRRKIYELFTSRIITPGDSDSVKLELNDAFIKYGIFEKTSETSEDFKYNMQKLEKYSIIFEYSLLDYKVSETFGGSGRSSGLLSFPAGIGCDPDDNLLIADYGNDRVQKFDGRGHFIYEFGSFAWEERNTSSNNIGTSNAATFNEPSDVAATAKNIFVSERGNNRIQKFDRDGNFILYFGGEGKSHGRMSAPRGIAVDRSSYIWVCDSKNDRVQKFDVNGNYMLELGGFGYGSGKLNEPTDISIDSKNNVYILDANNQRIVCSDEYGNIGNEISFKAMKGLREASALAVLLDKFVLVGASFGDNAKIVMYGTGGNYAGVIEGGMRSISGLAVDGSANIFACDSAQNKVFKFTPSDDVRTSSAELKEFINKK